MEITTYMYMNVQSLVNKNTFLLRTAVMRNTPLSIHAHYSVRLHTYTYHFTYIYLAYIYGDNYVNECAVAS